MSHLDRTPENLRSVITGSDDEGFASMGAEGVPDANASAHTDQVALAFDVGTSPHGLPAGNRKQDQETPEAESNSPFAKPVLTLPEVYRSEKVRSACRTIEAAAREHHYPLVLTTSQIKHVEWAVSRALEDAIDALECEPVDYHHEIQPDIDAYNQIYALLKLAKAARKGEPNEDWRWKEDRL